MSPTRYHYATLLGLIPNPPPAIYTTIIFIFLFMNSQTTPSQPTPNTPHRKIDVILLTDNREANTQERPLLDFRCSAFKGTSLQI
jgi:hypothetical protein